jgi:hypothetical protein
MRLIPAFPLLSQRSRAAMSSGIGEADQVSNAMSVVLARLRSHFGLRLSSHSACSSRARRSNSRALSARTRALADKSGSCMRSKNFAAPPSAS